MAQEETEWKLEGQTIHDRALEVAQRFMGDMMGRTTGMERMMADQAVRRGFPRLEQTIRSRSEEQLRDEIARIKQVLDEVVGDKSKKTGTATRKVRRKARGKRTRRSKGNAVDGNGSEVGQGRRKARAKPKKRA